MKTLIWLVIFMAGLWFFVEACFLLFLCIFKFLDKRING